jgi:DNA-binding response OmpR family regulator
MAKAKKKILIIEDDLDVVEMLNAYLNIQGYEVLTVNWGEDGIKACLNFKPDIVILDIHLPDIDGYQVARRLRSNRRTSSIPIIFLTAKRTRLERLQGLELGADDYISKPFDVQELLLRIRNALHRAEQDTLTNPVSGLPDGRLVDERILETLPKPGWSMLIVSLENLDIFRESYGFVASDDVLRAVSLMIHNSMKELGGAEDFLGHLSTTDFVLITEPEHATPLAERVHNRLEQSLDYFYPIKDRDKGETRSKRLLVKVGILQSADGHFSSLDDLKISLLRKKR